MLHVHSVASHHSSTAGQGHPPQTGPACPGSSIRTGSRSVDTWAFHSTDLHECMSMQHTRAALGHIMVRVGDSLVTNQRRPILTL